MPNSSGSRSRSHAESVGPRLVGADLERCIVCNGGHITREGKRYKKLETVQLWRCHTCDRVFTPQRAKGNPHRPYGRRFEAAIFMAEVRGVI